MTCECGECRKCRHRAYMRDYYARNPEKIRGIAKASRERRIDSVRAYDRARGFRSPGEEKLRAHNAVKQAIRRSELQRQPCEKCHTTGNVEAHHDDYSKPLDVRWLCRPHHAEHHRRIGVAT